MKAKDSVRAIAVLVGAAGVVLACSSGSEPDPNVPKMLTPVEGAVLDNGCTPSPDSIAWDFDWSDVPGATAYQLTVINSASVFAQIDDSTLTQSTFHYSQPSTYTSETTGWTWWVRANVNGVWHDWAGPRDFSVEPVNTDCP